MHVNFRRTIAYFKAAMVFWIFLSSERVAHSISRPFWGFKSLSLNWFSQLDSLNYKRALRQCRKFKMGKIDSQKIDKSKLFLLCVSIEKCGNLIIHTVPALMFLAVSRAKVNCSLWTEAASPYMVLLARLIASLAVLNGRATATGPKISSIVTVEAVLTFVINVGGYHNPLLFNFSGISILRIYWAYEK